MTCLFVARVLRYNLLYCKKVLIYCIKFRLQIQDCVEVALELGRGVCNVIMATVTAPRVRSMNGNYVRFFTDNWASRCCDHCSRSSLVVILILASSSSAPELRASTPFLRRPRIHPPRLSQVAELTTSACLSSSHIRRERCHRRFRRLVLKKLITNP